MNAVVNKEDQTILMSSLDFLNNMVNPARIAAGENHIENSKFIKKVINELDLSTDDKLSVVVNRNNQSYFNLDKTQMMLVGMRESKAVRRNVVAQLNAMEEALNKPLTTMEMIATSAQAVVELEAKQTKNELRLEILEDTLAKPLKGDVVPYGLLGIAALQRELPTTVSSAKLRELISIFGIKSTEYTVVRGEFLVPTNFYSFNEVTTMITKVVNSAKKVTNEYYTSHYLGNAKFKITKR
ncbi:MAG: hypothetical protein HRU18_03030 [Pseudoalteromonas sp.]|uniref:hypothetical protein n=1 Tax=Pseudoalteromonas sp. TaxID=53249 RepID=UPI001D586F1E|nr:hypothetical protein [Pseudoalteromonas sp.]NRA77158.1 hypothetical protein [Pseudoalteromonas sp.]